MGAVAPFVAIAAAGMQAIGSIQQGNAQKQMADYNATVEQQNAIQARNAAAANMTQQAYQTSRIISAQKAAAGAAGVDPNSGSPLDVMTDTAARGAYEQLKTKYQGQLSANYDISQANLALYQGNQAQSAGYMRALSGSLMTGASYFEGASRAPSVPRGGYDSTSGLFGSI